MTDETNTKRFHLPGVKLGFYSLPAVTFAAMGIPLVIFLPPYYHEVVGMNVGIVGLAFMFARIWDLFTDPLAGVLQDRTRTRFGRRRLWLVLAAPIMAIAAWFLFFPPQEAGLYYLLASLFVLYVGYTLVNVAHLSWGAELAANADERSRIQGWREFAVVGGMLSVLIAPEVVQRLGIGTFETAVQLMGWFIIIGVPATVLIAVSQVPEPPAPVQRSPGIGEIVPLLVRNKLFLFLLLVEIFIGLSSGILGSLFRFYFITVAELPNYANAVLLAYFLTGLIAVPIWLMLSYKIGKRNTMVAALTYAAVTTLMIVFIPAGNVGAAFGLMLVAGVAYGATPFLLRAMTADLIKRAEAKEDMPVAGIFYGLLLMFAKIGLALAVGVTYLILDFFGFDGRLATDNSQAAKNALQFCFVALPAILFTIAAVSVYRFPNELTGDSNARES